MLGNSIYEINTSESELTYSYNEGVLPLRAGEKVQFSSPFVCSQFRKIIYFTKQELTRGPRRAYIVSYFNDNFL